jgi:AraC-like DNA-binding protein
LVDLESINPLGFVLSFLVKNLKFDKNISLRFLEILLVIVSSAGLLHGLLFAIYLSFFKKKKTTTNFLLSLILILMAFRIGKSVMLNFGENLEPMFIFIGLATLLSTGPLLRWYVLSMTSTDFKISKVYAIELIPFCAIFISGFFISEEWFNDNSKTVIILFGSVLAFIYLHFAFYIYLSWKVIKVKKRHYFSLSQTKTQKAIFKWLSQLIIGFVVLWISYVLNILEEEIPYVIGPIVYSITIYFLSFKAFQLRATEIDGSAFKENNNSVLFAKISKLIIDDKIYLESDISLSKIGKLIAQSSQKTSSVINQYAKRNFNDYINYHRIQHAKSMLLAKENEKFTISSIAFDTGFSSLSSFNSAFKKFEGITPTVYRSSKI